MSRQKRGQSKTKTEPSNELRRAPPSEGGCGVSSRSCHNHPQRAAWRRCRGRTSACGPNSFFAWASKAVTICFTTSSKNRVASRECRIDLNSKETWREDAEPHNGAGLGFRVAPVSRCDRLWPPLTLSRGDASRL